MIPSNNNQHQLGGYQKEQMNHHHHKNKKKKNNNEVDEHQQLKDKLSTTPILNHLHDEIIEDTKSMSPKNHHQVDLSNNNTDVKHSENEQPVFIDTAVPTTGSLIFNHSAINEHKTPQSLSNTTNNNNYNNNNNNNNNITHINMNQRTQDDSNIQVLSNNNNHNDNTHIGNRPKQSKIKTVAKIPLHWIYIFIFYFYWLFSTTFTSITGKKIRNPKVLALSPQISSSSSSPSSFAINNISRNNYKHQTLIVFINPISGEGKGVSIFESVRHLFEERNYTLHVTETKYKGDAGRITSQLSQKDCDGIVCVGGDGLINEVVNGLLNRDDQSISRHIPIGIIPAGTRNGLSNSLGISTIYDAVNIILRSQIHYIDVISISPLVNSNQYIFPPTPPHPQPPSSQSSDSNINNQSSGFFDFLFNRNTNQQQNHQEEQPIEHNNYNIDIYGGGGAGGYVGGNYHHESNYQYKKIYSIVYTGWGIISYRDKIQENVKWTRKLKPYISKLYSLFASLPLKQLNSTLYYQPSIYHHSPHLYSSNGDNHSSAIIPTNINLLSLQDISTTTSSSSSSSSFTNTTSASTNSQYCIKNDYCQGCKQQYRTTIGGKKSINDITDWIRVEGSTEDNPYGLTFFIAGNSSHISKDLNLFPCSHLSDGFIDLVVSTENNKKKLLPWLFSDSLSNLLNNNNTTTTTTTNNNNPNNNIGYCKTKEIIFSLKSKNNKHYPPSITPPTTVSTTTTIPLTVDGELYQIQDVFGYYCNSIKVESQRSMCAIYH